MPKRKRYGNYVENRKGVKYARVYLPLGNKKYKVKRILLETIGGTANAAKQWALNEIDRHKNKIPGKKENITFEDAARWYAKNKIVPPVFMNGVKVEGVKDYKRQRNKINKLFIPYFEGKKVSAFTDNDFIEFARERRKTVSQATINRDLSLLRPMFKEFYKLEWIGKEITFDIINAAEIERTRVVSFEEENLLLAQCVRFETITKKRKGVEYQTTIRANREHLRIIIIGLSDTAMRLNEFLQMKWDDIDLEKCVITIPFFNAKTERSRRAPLSKRFKTELLKLPHRKDQVITTGNPTRSFNTACVRAENSKDNINNLTFTDINIHDLRHTAITRMIRAGIPHAEVMKISGHTQMKTFMRYLNLVDETVSTTASQFDKFLSDTG